LNVALAQELIASRSYAWEHRSPPAIGTTAPDTEIDRSVALGHTVPPPLVSRTANRMSEPPTHKIPSPNDHPSGEVAFALNRECAPRTARSRAATRARA